MSLLDTILEKVKHSRNLKDASIKIFKRNILILAEAKDIKNFDFLKNRKRIEFILSGYKPETQNSILQSVNRVLEQVDEPELLDTYRNLYYEVHNRIKRTPTDIKTETQEKNWISWDDVKKKEAELIEKAKDTEKWEDILYAFVLMLYASFEPRRNQDYLNMVIIRRLQYPFSNTLDKNKNYLFLKPRLIEQKYHHPIYTGKQKVGYEQERLVYPDDYYFLFNKFKTSKTFGFQGFPVPIDIKDFFMKYYYPNYPAKKGKENALLVDSQGKPLTAVNSITRILNSIFGKNIGASMLRHIYLTHKYGETYKEREIVSERMGHSIGTQHKYVKKKDQ